MRNNKRFFITVEGIEGVGKSTQTKFIADYLRKKNIIVCQTREPGGTEIAEKIRAILLSHHEEKMAFDTELLLMFAARAQHIALMIKPSLDKHEWVVCDRFTDASFAYQGYGREVDWTRIELLEKFTQGNLQPDLTILLDMDVDIALSRAKARSHPDRFESEHHDFFKRVRQGYLERAKLYPNRFKIINADQSIEKIQQQISTILDTLL